jgi:hypothetical protein
VSLAGQWNALGSELPETWSQADLRLELGDRSAADRAAALLGPAQPYRVEPTVLRLSSARDGSATSPDAVARLLARLDKGKINGTLTLIGSQKAAPRVAAELTTLVESWERALSELPADWSDLYAEIEFPSSDYIQRAAVLCIQMNPRRDGERNVFRFRAARKAGYGVSPGMARRCLERCDEEDIRGSVHVLRALSDTQLVATQGPVWLLAGKTV